jgi:hypothetical protein
MNVVYARCHRQGVIMLNVVVPIKQYMKFVLNALIVIVSIQTCAERLKTLTLGCRGMFSAIVLPSLPFA